MNFQILSGGEYKNYPCLCKTKSQGIEVFSLSSASYKEGVKEGAGDTNGCDSFVVCLATRFPQYPIILSHL